MRKQTAKRGFTVTELVIVIVVIAILAAVLIPTFASLIKKANRSADVQMVKNLNTIVTAESLTEGEIKTAHDAIVAATENGYNVAKITPTADDRIIVWDGGNSRFALLDEKGKEIFPKDGKTGTPKANQFVVSDTYPAEGAFADYGVYLTEANTQTEILDAKTGLDVGYNSDIVNVSYTGTEKVIIRTDSQEAHVEINNAEAEVDWYGVTYTLAVKNAAMSSVHIYGDVLCRLVIEKGNVVVEPGAAVETIYVQAANASDFALTVVDGAKIGLVTADKTGLLGGINVPSGTHTLDYTEGAVAYSATTGEAYTSFADAFSKTASGQTVTLLSDITTSDQYYYKAGKVIVNLNNHTMTTTSYYGFYMYNNKCDYTVENGTINSQYQLAYGNKGKITLNNVHATVTGDAAFYNYGYVLTIDEESVIDHTYTDNAAIQLKGTSTTNVYGKINHSGSFGVFQSNGASKTDNNKLNIYEGAVINGGSTIMFIPSPTTVNIYGGTMTANSIIAMKAGSLNVYGGTLHAIGQTSRQEGLAPASASGGIALDGSTIHIDSHTGYAGEMRIELLGGTLISDNGYILCETGNLADITNIVMLHVGGGTFNSKYGNILVTTPAEGNVIIDEGLGVTRVEPIPDPIKIVEFSNRYTIPAAAGTYPKYTYYSVSVLDQEVDGVNILAAMKQHFANQGLNLTEAQWATAEFAAGSNANVVKTIRYDSSAK